MGRPRIKELNKRSIVVTFRLTKSEFKLLNSVGNKSVWLRQQLNSLIPKTDKKTIQKSKTETNLFMFNKTIYSESQLRTLVSMWDRNQLSQELSKMKIDHKGLRKPKMVNLFIEGSIID